MLLSTSLCIIISLKNIDIPITGWNKGGRGGSTRFHNEIRNYATDTYRERSSSQRAR
jgi:hypothetical protein